MKVQDLKPGDIIEWRTTKQLEITTVNKYPQGDVEILGKLVGMEGRGGGIYLWDTELLLIAHGDN